MLNQDKINIPDILIRIQHMMEQLTLKIHYVIKKLRKKKKIQLRILI